MDDLRRICVRLLGEGPETDQAEAEAREAGGSDPEALLAAGILAIRPRLSAPAGGDVPKAGGDAPTAGARGLAGAVAAELRAATSGLTPAQRELLALRELLGLDYRQIASATGTGQPAVPGALARARLDLRTALRGPSAPTAACVEYDRALETIARRQDGVDVPAADEDWLIAHLGHCRACGQAHASMLEATACYRAWAPDDGAAAADAA